VGKKIIAYFNERAGSYLGDSNRWPWRQFRKKEVFAIETLLSPTKGSSLIDLGSGPGFYSLHFRDKFSLDCTGVDSAPEMINVLKKNGINGFNIPLEEIDTLGPYDNAIAAGVFEFIENPELSVKAISRVLSPGGKCVLLIPADGVFGECYRFHHSIQQCETFIRSVSDYKQLFCKFGFKLTDVKRVTLLSTALLFEKG